MVKEVPKFVARLRGGTVGTAGGEGTGGKR